MDSNKDCLKGISKNAKSKHCLQTMKVNYEIKETLMEERRKKINSYNRVINSKTGLTKKCTKNPKRKVTTKRKQISK